MHNIAMIIKAKIINITANGMVKAPNLAETIEVPSVNIAKNNNNTAAITNEMIGINLGKQ